MRKIFAELNNYSNINLKPEVKNCDVVAFKKIP